LFFFIIPASINNEEPSRGANFNGSQVQEPFLHLYQVWVELKIKNLFYFLFSKVNMVSVQHIFEE